MRRRLSVIRTGLVLALLGTVCAQEPTVHESAHYRLVAHPPFTEGAEYLRLAEALHAQLERHFGARPPDGQRLEVHFWPDAASYRKGGAEDGIPEGPLSAGGLYWTGTKRAYFWRQPSANFTRHLFLHELTHQFHFLAVMDNQARSPGWYTEGIAEHFGHHRWDGTTLECGRDDVLGLEEDIPRIVEDARTGRYDVCAVVADAAGAAKPTSWAAVHYLLVGADASLRARFRELEKRLWSGELAGRAFAEALFGSDCEAARMAANRWLGALVTTWKIEWIHWDARGADLVGESQVVALVRTRETYAKGARLAATLHVESGSAGLVLAYRSPAEFLAIYRRPSGRIELVRRENSTWTPLLAADGPKGTSTRLAVEIDAAGTLVVRAGDLEVLRKVLGAAAGAGAVGLFTDAGRTRFSGVEFGAR